uniref:Uncharacterized protein n=1 Tax=Alexandrium catenella TaxID=2925 RepID=A0A7S1QZI4_ALECA
MTVVWQCPYQRVCPLAYYCTCLVAIFAGLMGFALTCIGCSLAHINRLSEADLAPKTMTMRTKRWGIVSKSCPCFSRWLLTLSGAAAFGGLLVGAMVCPPKGDKQWGEDMCEAPPSSRQPDPLFDFGMVSGCWAIIAVMGCCAARNPNQLPFTYEPIPEEPPDLGMRVTLVCRRLTLLCHP